MQIELDFIKRDSTINDALVTKDFLRSYLVERNLDVEHLNIVSTFSISGKEQFCFDAYVGDLNGNAGKRKNYRRVYIGNTTTAVHNILQAYGKAKAASTSAEEEKYQQKIKRLTKRLNTLKKLALTGPTPLCVILP